MGQSVRSQGGPVFVLPRALLCAGVGFALAVAAALLAPGSVHAQLGNSPSPRECVEDNDTGDGDCATSTNGLGFPADVAASADGRSVYAVAQGDSAIVNFVRNTTTGALTPIGCIDDVDPGEAPDSCAQTTDGMLGATEVVVSRDGADVYVGSEGDRAIVWFNRNPSTSGLNVGGCVRDDSSSAGCSKSSAGLDIVDDIAITQDGKNLYAISRLDSAVVTLNRDTATGELTPAGCIEDVGGPSLGCNGLSAGLGFGSGIDVSPDGTSVYAVSRGDSAIVHFQRNTSPGALLPMGCIDDPTGPGTCASSTPGLETARSVEVSPDGRTVYVTAITSPGLSALTRFDRNTTTGALSPARCLSPQAGCDFLPPESRRINETAITPAGAALLTGGNDLALFGRDATGTEGYLDCLGEVVCSQGPNGVNRVGGVTVAPNSTSVYTASFFGPAANNISHSEITGPSLPRRYLDLIRGRSPIGNVRVALSCGTFPCFTVISGRANARGIGGQAGGAATAGKGAKLVFKLKRKKVTLDPFEERTVRLKLKRNKASVKKLRRLLRSKNVRKRSRLKVKASATVEERKPFKNTVKLRLKP